MADVSEKVLDVTQLPHGTNHKAVLDTFDHLKAGESFILHNDHDPKPLYYQFVITRKDTFTWDYLKNGPDVVEVRIGKKMLSQKEEEKTENGEKVLDGICLDPSVKFQTIMKTFNDLKEGEHFILHNDHDPKPLYYQLSATHGDSFTWEYLKQGPDAFDIRIGKKVLSESHEAAEQKSETKAEEFHDHILFADNAPETARTIVAKDYRKAKVFRKYGLDYAWKGNRTVTEMCRESGVSEDDLRKELAAAEKDFSEVIPSRDYYHWDMAFLSDYVLQTHHQYVKDNAERISAIAKEVGKAHGKDYPCLQELGEKVRPMIKDFMVHMSKEENVLFPAIKFMLELERKGEKKAGPGGDIARGIRKMEEEHDETRVFLRRFREITNSYKLPDGACEAHKQLYKDLQLFENDCYLHVHLENNILFPKTIILEKMISKG
jgi:regulator of cell morphogenesis and NO signaling